MTAWLLTYLLHSTLLLVGAAGVTWWLRDPGARERVWKLAIVASLLTASAARWLPGELRPVLDLSRSSASAALGAVDDTSPQPAGRGAAVSSAGGSEHGDIGLGFDPARSGDSLAATRAPDRGLSSSLAWARFDGASGWSAAVLALWSLGGLFLLLRYGWAARQLHRRLSTRTELRGGVPTALLAELCAQPPAAATPRLTQVDDLSTPIVLNRHEICLPRRVAEELPERELAAILAHELAHIRRGDLFWLRLCAGFECVLFVQPLNRFARRRLFEAVELLCDDWAGERTGDRLELAQGLATVARWAQASPAPLPLPCLGGDRGPLLNRVQRLLAAPDSRRRPAAITAVVAGAAVLLAFAGPAVLLDQDAAQPDFDTLGLDSLVVLRQQVGARAAERLLAFPDDWQVAYSEELALPGAKAVRILQRDRFDLSPKRGGGAYYSFATEDHDYNREPDLAYERDRLLTIYDGHVLDLGALSLEAVNLEAPPVGLDAAEARNFTTMVSFTPHEGDGTLLRDSVTAQCAGSAQAVAGHSYLLRSILPHEHDHLVAFRVMDVSPQSVVLVGRVIKTWPVAEPRRKPWPAIEWSYADAPDWLLQLDDPALFALRDDIEDQVADRLLTVPATVIAEHPELVGVPNAGLARLCPRGRYDFETPVRGGFAYYSFVTGSHDYDEEPDLSWSADQFTSGFAGNNLGAFLDLGDLPLADVSASTPPAGLAPEQRTTWDALHAPALSEDMVPFSMVPVVIGHTYVLRSVLEGEHDVLAAFRPVQQDERGMTIAWRVLTRYSD